MSSFVIQSVVNSRNAALGPSKYQQAKRITDDKSNSLPVLANANDLNQNQSNNLSSNQNNDLSQNISHKLLAKATSVTKGTLRGSYFQNSQTKQDQVKDIDTNDASSKQLTGSAETIDKNGLKPSQTNQSHFVVTPGVGPKLQVDRGRLLCCLKVEIKTGIYKMLPVHEVTKYLQFFSNRGINSLMCLTEG